MIFQVSFIDFLVPAFLSFREGLEAILVVVIIVLYLKNSDQMVYYKYVLIGAVLAILSSILLAILFIVLLSGFTGFIEQVFEGLTFIISGAFIITLIFWMSREGPRLKAQIETKVEFSVKSGKILSLISLTYVIIIREGIELVLLLVGATSIGTLNQFGVIFGSIVGLSISVIIGIFIFYGVKTINLSVFFKITNVILILFAAGLITYGIHELIEAQIVHPIIEEVWNIKHILPESFPDGNPLTPEWLEIIGSLLKALFGYNANPSLLEITIYPSLLSLIGIISYKLWKRSDEIVIVKSLEKRKFPS